MTIGTAAGLAATLEGRSDDKLAALLLARPDLARPLPNGLLGLAARAVSPASVRAVLLDVTLADLQAAQARAPHDRLRALALAWPQDGAEAVPEALAQLVDGVDLGDPAPEPPAVATTPVSDDAAGLAAAQAISLTDEALRRIAAAPPRVLRTGGMPTADVRALARVLDLDLPRLALLLEVSAAAHLLGEVGDEDPTWAPTTDYDEWRLTPAAERWAVLAEAWRTMRRAPHLVGSTPPGARTAVNSLSDGADWGPVRLVREHALAELATLDGGCATRDLVARVRWRHPLVRVPDRDAVLAAVVEEATWLGIVADGGLSTPGRALLNTPTPDGARAAAAMAPLLPAPATTALLTPDLTAVVPGLLEVDVADLLLACAEPESRGGATVLRFTAASLDRALDAGWTPQLLRERLTALGGVLPQPLDYLIDDAARRHAPLTIGTVSAYLTCPDAATLAELATAPRLRLRVVAPTVAVTDLTAPVLLARLRAAGRTPAVAGPDGAVHVVGAAAVRAKVRRPTLPAPPDLASARQAVAVIRSRDAQHAADDPATIAAVLAQAAARGASVRVDHIRADGTPVELALTPHLVAGGRVIGTVGAQQRTLSLAHIARVHP